MEEVFIAKLVDFVVDPVEQLLVALLHGRQRWCPSSPSFGDADLEALVGLGPGEHLGVVGGEGVATAVEQRVVGVGVLVVLLQLDVGVKFFSKIGFGGGALGRRSGSCP